MEMIVFVLGWAGIILWLAAPFLLVAAIAALAVSGTGALLRGLKSSSVRSGVIGVAMITAAGLAGYLTFVWLSGPEPIIPTLEIAQPRAHSTEPLPGTWVQHDKSLGSIARELLVRGTIRRVLSPYPGNTLPSDWSTIDPDVRKTLWEEARIKPGAECAAAFADAARAKDQRACIEFVRAVVPGGQLTEPHFLVETRREYPDEFVSYYLVSGESRQLIAHCSAHAPKAQHPIFTYWTVKAQREVWSAFARRCKWEAVQGGVVAAVDLK